MGSRADAQRWLLGTDTAAHTLDSSVLAGDASSASKRVAQLAEVYGKKSLMVFLPAIAR